MLTARRCAAALPLVVAVTVVCLLPAPTAAQAASPARPPLVTLTLNQSVAAAQLMEAAFIDSVSTALSVNASRVDVVAIVAAAGTAQSHLLMRFLPAGVAADDALTPLALTTSLVNILARSSPARTLLYNAFFAHYMILEYEVDFLGFTATTGVVPSSTPPTANATDGPIPTLFSNGTTNGNGTATTLNATAANTTGLWPTSTAAPVPSSATVYLITCVTNGQLGNFNASDFIFFVARAMRVPETRAVHVRSYAGSVATQFYFREATAAGDETALQLTERFVYVVSQTDGNVFTTNYLVVSVGFIEVVIDASTLLPPPAAPGDGSSGLSAGAQAAIAIVVILVVLGAVAVVLVLLWRKRQRDAAAAAERREAYDADNGVAADDEMHAVGAIAAPASPSPNPRETDGLRPTHGALRPQSKLATPAPQDTAGASISDEIVTYSPRLDDAVVSDAGSGDTVHVHRSPVKRHARIVDVDADV